MWPLRIELIAVLAWRWRLACAEAPATDYDVIIIGMGPVGIYSAQLLHGYGVKSILGLEKHHETYYSPRAVAWDDYTLRSAQAIGKDLSDYMFWHAWSLDYRWHLEACQSGLRSGRAATRWQVACDFEANDARWRKNIMVTSGMPVSSFHQPNWETEMRRRLGTLEGITVSFGSAALETRIVEDEVCEVVTRAVGGEGPNTTYRARFCIGADGKNSKVRQQLGLDFKGTTFKDQPWIVIDTEVHDAEYLRNTWISKEGIGFVMAGRDGPTTIVKGKELVCPFVFFPTPAFFNSWWEDANRKASVASTEEERLAIRDETIRSKWQEAVNTSVKADATPYPPGTAFRFEFLLQGEMDAEEATSEDFVNQLLVDCAEIDPTRVKMVRKVVYNFDARRASKWRVGPVLLAGDAAHCMPPFQGQGMNSGIRDAANLAWKLALILRGDASDSLLDSYEPERRTNLDLVTRDSEDLGEKIMEDEPVATFIRDIIIKFMMLLRKYGGFQFTYISDLPHIKSNMSVIEGQQDLAGELMPAPEVLEEGVVLTGQRKLFLDDLSAPNGFTLVLCGGGRVDASTATLQASEETLQLLRKLGAAVVAVAPYERRGKPPSSHVPVIAGLSPSRRCRDAVGSWTKWTRKKGVVDKIVVVRPDKYIYGFFSTVDAVGQALEAALHRPPSPDVHDAPKNAEL